MKKLKVCIIAALFLCLSVTLVRLPFIENHDFAPTLSSCAYEDMRSETDNIIDPMFSVAALDTAEVQRGIAAYKSAEAALYGSELSGSLTGKITAEKLGATIVQAVSGNRKFKKEKAISIEKSSSDFATYACKKTADNKLATYAKGELSAGDYLFKNEVTSRREAYRGLYGALASDLSKMTVSERTVSGVKIEEGNGRKTIEFSFNENAFSVLKAEMKNAVGAKRNLDFSAASLTVILGENGLPIKVETTFTFTVDLLGGVTCNGQLCEVFSSSAVA